MIEEKRIIELLIKKSITDHLVKHVRVKEDDKRDRIDILVDEASREIMKHFDVEFKKFIPKH
jgi:hypothetical protein